MFVYALKRLALLVPTLIAVTFLVFLTVHLIPGDPAIALLGTMATEERIVQLREELGLNEPLIVQYKIWLQNLLQGDLGQSISMRGMPVSEIVLEKYVNTLILTAGALIVCSLGGIVIGTMAGLHQYSWFDKTSMFLAQFGANVPVFWLAIVLMWIFALELQWLPSSGMYNLRTGPTFFGIVQHLVLPAIATATVSLAIIARSTRNSIIDCMNSEFIRTFRAQGLPEWLIIGKHVFRNIMSSLVNITGLQAGYILGGAIFIEVVFSWPGLGSQLYRAIVTQDVPVIQGGVLMIAVTFVLINLVTDLVVASLNPKLSS